MPIMPITIPVIRKVSKYNKTDELYNIHLTAMELNKAKNFENLCYGVEKPDIPDDIVDWIEGMEFHITSDQAVTIRRMLMSAHDTWNDIFSDQNVWSDAEQNALIIGPLTQINAVFTILSRHISKSRYEDDFRELMPYIFYHFLFYVFWSVYLPMDIFDRYTESVFERFHKDIYLFDDIPKDIQVSAIHSLANLMDSIHEYEKSIEETYDNVLILHRESTFDGKEQEEIEDEIPVEV